MEHQEEPLGILHHCQSLSSSPVHVVKVASAQGRRAQASKTPLPLPFLPLQLSTGRYNSFPLHPALKKLVTPLLSVAPRVGWGEELRSQTSAITFLWVHSVGLASIQYQWHCFPSATVVFCSDCTALKAGTYLFRTELFQRKNIFFKSKCMPSLAGGHPHHKRTLVDLKCFKFSCRASCCWSQSHASSQMVSILTQIRGYYVKQFQVLCLHRP